MRHVRAVDRHEAEMLIRASYATASFTGAAWGGKLERLETYLPRDDASAPRGPAALPPPETF